MGQTHWQLPLHNLKGRKVRIAKPNEYLTVCEVEAWVNHEYDPSEDEDQVDLTVPNLALKKTTSNSGNDDSALAVDGNTEGNYFRGSCSTTGPTQGAHWWKVEL